MDTDESHKLTSRIAPSFLSIDPESWDRCSESSNPFISHCFLLALEESGCTTTETGWTPYPLLIEDDWGHLVAAAPMYLKDHSYGEYIFDHSWADAWQQTGKNYYPKLQISSPFTPVTGPRLLARSGHDYKNYLNVLTQKIEEITENLSCSSAHITFCTKSEWDLLNHSNYLLRTSEQFHWINRNYVSFEDFLSDLNSRKRKSIKKERVIASFNGQVTFKQFTGNEITEMHWDIFFNFYLDTGHRKWGTPYLNRKFFSLLGERMSDDILLIFAYKNGQAIAGALNFIGKDVLYGRYWGTNSYHPALHFEVCYYQAIEYAIYNNLEKVEAGAQGSHKLSRGYLPTHTHSAHFILDQKFRSAVSKYIMRERQEIDLGIVIDASRGPFRSNKND